MNTKPKRILFIFGTRPEAIKMAPLIREFQKNEDAFNTRICVTGQHREMLDQVLEFFEIEPHADLALMKKNQTLTELTARAIIALDPVLEKEKPDLVFVQGDTTTVMCGALSSFYKKIPVAHLEAGLRTGEKFSPYPEEINRVLAGHLADFHFAPTDRAVSNLNRETIEDNVHKVGNTVIDALFTGLKLIEERGEDVFYDRFSMLDFSKKLILITGHRRESFGEPFEAICRAISKLATAYPQVEFLYPVHLNPKVQEPVYKYLSNIDNIHLIEPVDYPAMIWLENKSYLVLTDSGGVQEEAPSLGKPVLVMREVTERQEGVEAGTAKLVGPNEDKIIKEVSLLLDDREAYERMANAVNPYGDGTTSKQIVSILKEHFFHD